MKIRKKVPKVSKAGPPLFVIGHTSPTPSIDELRYWFDLEYGGPLKVEGVPSTGSQASSTGAPLRLTHGPWSGSIQLQGNAEESRFWQEHLGWSHGRVCAVLAPSVAPGRDVANLVLHVTRIARGLTLLTQGTCFDTATQRYWNPSDWYDHPLGCFIVDDHVTAEQSDDQEQGRDRFVTKGLAKFVLDELESFQAVGLPGQTILNHLQDLAEVLLQQGRTPNLGTSLELEPGGVRASFPRHRTVTVGGIVRSFREVVWDSR